MHLQIRLLAVGKVLLAQVLNLTEKAAAKAEKGYRTTQGFSFLSGSALSFDGESSYLPTVERFKEDQGRYATFAKVYDTSEKAESARRRFIIGVSEFNKAI